MQLDKRLKQTACKQPEHPAIFGPAPEGMLTYAELDEVVDQVAAELRTQGIRPRDCVGLHLPSGVQYIICTFAVWRAGGCVVPIPVELADAEKQRQLKEIHFDSVISAGQDRFFETDHSRGTWSPLESGSHLLSITEPIPIPDGLAEINAAFIRFTSGTTGDSKGVVLGHETIWDRIEAANTALHLDSDDRVVWLLSMSYHFTVSIVGYLSYGCTIILPENLFAPAIAQAIERHRGTFLYGSPLHYMWLSECEFDVDLSSLRLAVSTTCELDGSFSESFKNRYNLPVTQALGIIEVGLPCINIDFASEHPSAVGRVLPAYEFQLRESVPDSDHRELLLAGPGIIDAYYKPWRTQDEIMDSGWFATGDVCSIDDEGCITIRGRCKEVINISGMKFFPQETEAVLRDHPKIEAARVFSVQLSDRGEIAHAQVIASTTAGTLPTVSELKRWCLERLAPYKVPMEIEYVTTFPRTASGKVLHRSTESS